MTRPQPREHAQHRKGWRVVAWLAAAVVLAAVFVAYRNPHFVVDIANRVWACF
ncbi:MAG: hypothetical protein LKCHEGNO_02852 [Burkholderiaceae bacterium]|nr:hypothetical protein [Burkholderiaceae bacterium]